MAEFLLVGHSLQFSNMTNSMYKIKENKYISYFGNHPPIRKSLNP